MFKHLKKYLIAGLLLWLPIWVTFILVRFIIDLMDKTVATLPKEYQPDHLLGMHIPGIGLIFTLIILFITGLLLTNFIGHKIVHWWERIIDRIPLVRSIYGAVKQVAHTLFQPTGNAFRKVLLIEYPRKGIWSFAFLTSEKFSHTSIGEPLCTVFVPTTPNPTSGFILLVPKSETVQLDITVEDALKMVVSLGVVTPESFEKQLHTKQHDQETQ